jgi:hypothetical protein
VLLAAGVGGGIDTCVRRTVGALAVERRDDREAKHVLWSSRLFGGNCATLSIVLRRIFDSDYFIAEHDVGAGLLVVRRTSARFSGVPQCETEHERIARTLDAHRSNRLHVMFDVRIAPSKGDLVMERALQRMGARVFQGMGRVAFLMKSSVGKAQAQRLLAGIVKESKASPTAMPIEYRVFQDENEALAWAREGEVTPRQ